MIYDVATYLCDCASLLFLSTVEALSDNDNDDDGDDISPLYSQGSQPRLLLFMELK